MNSILKLPNSSTLKLTKPSKIVVPLAVGLSWTADPEYIYQEKMDGRFEVRRAYGKHHPIPNPIGETLLAGEYVRGEFYAFDLLTLHGEDCRNWPLRERLDWLDQVFQNDIFDCTGRRIHRVPSNHMGGQFLREVLDWGGEGIVRKHLDSPWGTPMEACKRLETFICVVTGINAGQSVRISRIEGGEWNIAGSSSSLPSSTLHPPSSIPCGNVALLGGKLDRIRVGSILKIEGFGLTRAGSIREPRPCKDTTTSWLIQF